MDTYTVPVTFSDLDAAKHDAGSLVEALRTAGVHAELVGGAEPSRHDAGRPDPGPTTWYLRVRAGSEADARRQVQKAADGRFPPGVVLLGEPR